MNYLKSSVAAAAISSLALRPDQYARMDAEGDKPKETEADARRHADSEAGQKLDKLLTGIDSIHKRLDAADARMDAFEKREADARKDAEEKAAADKARKDAEEDKEEEKEEEADRKDAKKDARKDGEIDPPEVREADRKDARKDGHRDDHARKDARKDGHRDDHARKDEEGTPTVKHVIMTDEQRRADADRVTRLEAELITLRERMPFDAAHPDYNSLLAEQAKADPIFRAFGDSAPPPLNGELLINYRRRLVGTMKPHSTRWAKVDLAKLDSVALDIAQEQIYADADLAAHNPATVNNGQLRVIPGRTQAGHVMNSFVGDPASWMNEFGGQRRAVTEIVANK